MDIYIFIIIKRKSFYTLNGDPSYKVINPPHLQYKLHRKRKPACKHPYEMYIDSCLKKGLDKTSETKTRASICSRMRKAGVHFRSDIFMLFLLVQHN